MADHPILIFPTATLEGRELAGGGGSGVARPTPAQQHERLSNKLQTIVGGFAGLQEEVDGLDPERVVVFETVGSVTDVARRAREIPGLEWLDEMDVDDIEPVGGFESPDDAARRLPARLFAVMSNQQAIEELINLWRQWPDNWEGQTEENKPVVVERGLGAFKELFRHLTDVRHWGPKDRVQDTLLPWLERLDVDPDRSVKFEAELWYRGELSRRSDAISTLSRLVEEAGGAVLSQCAIPEIRYHGVLLEAPAHAVNDIARQITDAEYGELVRCEDVMFFRPGPQSVSVVTEDAAETGEVPKVAVDTELPPTVAILDGLPLERHEALDGHLIVDDPDNISAMYRPGQQCHGTAMASLIVHGDLEDPASVPLTRRIYVRPVLRPEEVMPQEFHERFPDDVLFVDLVHRAVRLMMEGDGDEPAIAPSVRVVNLSLGNPWQQFDRVVSPLAKLLDWLSAKYSILFIVAAGNQSQDLTVETDDFAGLDDDDAVVEIVRAMGRDQIHRRLFSPAESVNAIAVGATHEDMCGPIAIGVAKDVLRERLAASPLSTVASGFRRAVKPDVLLAGGRQLYTQRIGGADGRSEFNPAVMRVQPGQRVAAPSSTPGDLSRYWYERGTSNATAIATRWAALIVERLIELQEEPGGDALRDELLHVAAKTLLVHGASWGDLRSVIEQIAPENAGWQDVRKLVARFLGFGRADLERSTIASDQRVLLLGCSSITNDQGHVYNLPLPPSLSGTKYRRRLTATLAWVTPINTLHRDYRRAALFLKVNGEGGFDNTLEVHDQLASVGTVQHLIYESDRAVPIDGESTLDLKVNCRKAAGSFDDSVPYALAVTLEVAEPIGANIYSEIRESLRARARVR